MFNKLQNKFVEIVDKNLPYETFSERQRELKEKP